MKYNNILIENDDYLGLITINRPKKLNALNKETIAELHHAFRSLDEDEDIRVIIVTGSGEKAFVAGADISEFADFDVGSWQGISEKRTKYLFDFVGICLHRL